MRLAKNTAVHAYTSSLMMRTTVILFLDLFLLCTAIGRNCVRRPAKSRETEFSSMACITTIAIAYTASVSARQKGWGGGLSRQFLGLVGLLVQPPLRSLSQHLADEISPWSSSAQSGWWNTTCAVVVGGGS
jgi:hypothetical protein